jgi:hypothetical protein
LRTAQPTEIRFLPENRLSEPAFHLPRPQIPTTGSVVVRNADPDLLDSVYVYRYDSLLGTWYPQQRTIHRYDSESRRLETLQQRQDKDGAGWQEELWILYTYDIKSREIHRLTSHWSEYFSTWQPALSDSTAYDDLGRPIRFMEQAWHFATSNWLHTRQHLLQYDSAGRLHSRTEQHWDNNTWRNHRREHFSYLLPADTLEILSERPDPTNNDDWMPDKRVEFEYGSNGFLSEKRHSLWNATSGWVLRQRQQFQYQGTALTNAVDYLQETSGWYPYRREQYQYEAGGWLAGIVTQQWDPFISDWRNTFREERVPDEQGRLQTRHLFPWEPSAYGLVNSVRTLLSYNNKGDTVSSLTQHWNDLALQWIPAWREQHKHNGNGQPTLSTLVRWDPAASQWVFESRLLSAYLPDGQPEVSRYQRWRPDGQTWEDTYRLTYAYNQQGKPIAIVFQTKGSDGGWHPLTQSVYEYHPSGQTAVFRHQLYQEGSGWINEYQHRYTYNSENLLWEDELAWWDADNSTWAPTERTHHLYNPSGLVSQRVEQRMDQDWVNEFRSLFLYDINGLLLEELRQEWEPVLYTWRNELRNHRQYNQTGILLQRHRSRWNILADNWESSEKTDYLYNAALQLTGSTTSRWDGDNVGWTATEATLIGYDLLGHAADQLSQRRGPMAWAWMPYRQEEFFWRAALSATDPGAPPLLSAACDCRYANPYRFGSPIRCEGLPEGPWEMRLYHPTGTTVVRQTFHTAGDFVINGPFPAGMYLLVIHQQGKPIYHGKILLGG